jgi:hypothetical protein
VIELTEVIVILSPDFSAVTNETVEAPIHIPRDFIFKNIIPAYAGISKSVLTAKITHLWSIL